ncbi:MAG TPA: DUF1223 domain-containing protein [Xanthobacteraceae bacterium]|nr:DUF1223 domain-containing protein [Xanthobacteraceae bacterium]
MITPRRLPALLPLLAILATPALAAEPKPVVELFTSQGCSSCPPADRVLGELAREGRVIALSLPVDYWDYLGWKDTLAQHTNSMRQRGYASDRGGRVYTPQVVVNGAMQVIGSDRPAIEAACKSAAAKPAVPVTLARNGSNLEVDIGAGDGAPASVWLLTVTRATPVEIGRGENHGRTITYSNVVRSWQRVAEWNGTPMKSSVPFSDLNDKDADAVVVLVQPGSIETPGPVRGASMLELR